eukprot:g7787.t1
MQDDDEIRDCKWVYKSIALMDEFKRVGLVGTNVAQTLPCGGIATHRFWCSSYRSEKLKIPVQFIGCVDIGPFVLRRTAFLDAGGFDEGISPPGFPGIGLDFDLSIRMWLSGWAVLHFPATGIGRHTMSPQEGMQIRNTQGAQNGIRGKLWSHAGVVLQTKYTAYIKDKKFGLRRRIDELNKKLLKPNKCNDIQKAQQSFEQWEADRASVKMPQGGEYFSKTMWGHLKGVDDKLFGEYLT